MAFRFLREEIAKEIHWPDCWDVMTYPTLEEAVLAVVQAAGCSECKHLDGIKENKEDLQ